MNEANIESSESIKLISGALLKAQMSMGSASKSADNPYFSSKYADFNEVLKVCKPHLNANGILILQPTGFIGETPVVTTKLVHAESGEYISASMQMFEVKNMQSAGSSISYARRYTLQSLLAIPTSEDDDGEKTMKRQSNSSPKSAAPQGSVKATGGFGSRAKQIGS